VAFLVGIDIGGTFTDCAVVTEEGSVVTGKVPSTPRNLAEGFFGSARTAANALGLDLSDFLQQTLSLKHGATVGINTLVSRSGAKVGLLATKGHGDAIMIMNGAGRSAGVPIDRLLHVPATDKPYPLVPRQLIREIAERVDSEGQVVAPLDEAEVERAVGELVKLEVEAIAICFLWSFANPTHEERAKRVVQAVAPTLHVSVSSELVPRIGEYQRTAATVVNAYIGPRASRYVHAVQSEARAAGFSHEILFMQVSGGVTVPATAAQTPIFTMQSGPVAGLIGASVWGGILGRSNVINTDMGGTTFDVSLIHSGKPAMRDTTIVEQHEMYVPAVDVQSIGAGGGSLVWLDETRGTLRVGPHSAGAEPGPVCYGRGGTQPTVTDADLVQGFLNPAAALGGSIRLDIDAARAAIKGVGAEVGMDLMTTAAGITRIVDFQMADLIRKLTVERGLDPRDFTLFAYGGAGPVHVGVFARELGVKEVVVPLGNSSSVWSALGAAFADHVRVYDRVERQDAPFDAGRLTRLFEDLEKHARTDLRQDGIQEDRIVLERSAGIRFKAQVHDLRVAVPPGTITDEGAQEVARAFEERYAAVYGAGAGYREAGIEIANLRLTAIGQARRPSIRPAQEESSEPPLEAIGEPRDVYWMEEGTVAKSPVYAGQHLFPGNYIEGPAVIEFRDTTVVVRPGQHCTVDGYHNVVMTV
jgi:N-methylhydantoinase A